MPVSMMRNGLTAENSIFSQKPSIKVPRSKFDLSRLNCFTSDIGMLVPVDLIPTIPGDDVDLGCQYKVDFRPLLVPTLTAYKVRVHYYFCPMQYLWSGWESFISKGRSGNLSLTVPQLALSAFNSDNLDTGGLSGCTDTYFNAYSGMYHPAVPHSLIDFLVGNVPFKEKSGSNDFLPLAVAKKNGSDFTFNLQPTGYKLPDVSALPFLMYQKIYRSNYMDPNLYVNNTTKCDAWFPDDIDSSDWRFNYSASNQFSNGSNACKAYFVPQNITVPNKNSIYANFVPLATPLSNPTGVEDTCVNLTQLRYAMYSNDMFTTALPFLQRGPQTVLDLDVSEASLSVSTAFNFTDNPPFIASGSSSPVTFYAPDSGSDIAVWAKSSGLISDNVNLIPNSSYFNSSVSSSGTVSGISASFTAQQLRSLLAISVWQERNALTNGSYGQFIKVHFDSYPENQYCEPIYIGGTTSVFNVNSVVQTSASMDDSTPQGTQTGIAGSTGSGDIGHFRSKDFGYIMAIMSIIPDNVYVQQAEHWMTDKSPDDFYMPEYEQLSFQPILNRQLANLGTDSDSDLFGYSNRYVYMKQRDSIARGLFAMPSEVDAYYHSYVQSRIFSSTPKLTQQFVTVYPPNIDRSFLAYTGQPAFLVQFYSRVNAVRPLSYQSKPNTFGF